MELEGEIRIKVRGKPFLHRPVRELVAQVVVQVLSQCFLARFVTFDTTGVLQYSTQTFTNGKLAELGRFGTHLMRMSGWISTKGGVKWMGKTEVATCQTFSIYVIQERREKTAAKPSSFLARW